MFISSYFRRQMMGVCLNFTSSKGGVQNINCSGSPNESSSVKSSTSKIGHQSFTDQSSLVSLIHNILSVQLIFVAFISNQF